MTWLFNRDDYDETVAAMAVSPIASEPLPKGALVVRLLLEPTFHAAVCITVRGAEEGSLEVVVPGRGFGAWLMDQRGLLTHSSHRAPSQTVLDLNLAAADISVDAYAAFRTELGQLRLSDLVDLEENARDGLLVRGEIRDQGAHRWFAAQGISPSRSPAHHRFVLAVINLAVEALSHASSDAAVRQALDAVCLYVDERRWCR